MMAASVAVTMTAMMFLTACGAPAAETTQEAPPTPVEVLAVMPRYLPRWSWWILKVPGLREVLTWNLAIVLRRATD
jgi:hypothetical protein